MVLEICCQQGNIRGNILKKIDWELIYNLSDKKYELYSLNKDQGESINLIEIEKEKSMKKYWMVI